MQSIPATDSLTAYLDSIQRYPILAREEEVALARRVRAGDAAARDALVCANLRFVVSVAKKYQNRGLSLQDLINEGNLGLLHAARKFDETRGTKFISYAVWWVRQAMLQAILEHGRIVRLPSNRAGTMHLVWRRTNALRQELGREPTHAEVADGTPLSAEDVHCTLPFIRPALSLDGPAADGQLRLADLLADDRAAPPDEDLSRRALAESVRDALGMLRPREALVIRLYFGLDGLEPMTLEEIGTLQGITRERVRQIKEHALERLRHGRRGRALATWAS